ncbi:nitroreductase family protein [Halopseudomonas pelagia]|uniref:nitroreductase family protein n=1 Tax=Halopseudomonas pelagia TaxID=553151 RepID=UPI00039EA6B3|nr:nitroreductase [Halopseudomonas pelagia]|tara:strand:+ start:101 stop:664 length:564 start_codon:yes stop_codon:yes gene_type:complete
MDALQALHSRVSVPRLIGPAPTPDQQQALFKAALRAPDHAWLRPWRFLVVQGAALGALGRIFRRAALADAPDIAEEALVRFEQLPLRAPMIIVAISCHRVHEKVPRIEQDLSCAAAVSNMLVAAHAMGLGAVWRTGSLAYHEVVRQGLGLTEDEQLIAFLYLGQPAGSVKTLPELATQDFFQNWPGN